MNVIRKLSLFDDSYSHTFVSDGIKYTGSKLKLIPYILALACKVNVQTVLDGFSGTTRVSQAFAKSGYTVVSNDIAVWSEIFATCYLLNKKPANAYSDLIKYLNSIPSVDGWFTEYYGGDVNRGCSIQSDGLKKPWQKHNTRKLDAIRLEIENLNLEFVDKAVVLTSLILALDKVDNTLGHFASYLKNWSLRSYKDLKLELPNVFISPLDHQVHRSDILETAQNMPVDLAYLDPPYGSSNEKMPASRVRYNGYYHIWKSICLFDKPELFGKANRRVDSSDKVNYSPFEDFRRSSSGRYIAVDAIDRLLQSICARWIILSYSSTGRAPVNELYDVMSSNGKILEVVEVDYKKNVMANMKWTNAWVKDVELSNREFLFLLEK